MNIIPCEQNAELRKKIEEYSDVLKAEGHKLGLHGLGEAEFYNSGVFRGAIERIRGQFSATMREKREFVQRVLNYMQDNHFIKEWESSGEANRHDYSVTLPSDRVAVIELKGCLDGNNTNIFQRPANANEFIVWSVCTNPGADPRHNAWSGIHTRLSTEIITRQELVDGCIIWDMVCATIGRPCPKVKDAPQLITEIGPYKLPPPCIYLFPGTIPQPRTNPAPKAQPIESVHFLKALHECFKGGDSELSYVDFDVEYKGSDIIRTTRIRRGSESRESSPTAIRRT
ncbi:hypothetical protein AH2_00034 [Burkholderia phage vB_BceS_AH2]|uniref:Uncharacterized protein n=1 Tax=Burkholderia phage vB_BceS_AH2 TaxID=1133022 RepID=I6NTM1_9CAUD|nr:hypothetical protein B613_gp34 [Burkholderia phage vB_BceS_AH2]AEY69544.1 hypothetical protein AH2_00034 [Burkholderia phage vB_BceS_AH2]